MSSTLVHVAGLDVERGHGDEFDAWYTTEHLPGLLDRAGWVRARLYRCLEGEPSRLVVFDLEPDADLGVWPRPFLDERFGRRVRNYHARTMRRISAAGADPSEAELINMITVDVDDEHADEVSRWYTDVHVPEIVACPGWLGNERFESLTGAPRFMAIYGLEDAERPFATPEYEDAVGWGGHGEHLRGYHGFRIYRHEMSSGSAA